MSLDRYEGKVTVAPIARVDVSGIRRAAARAGQGAAEAAASLDRIGDTALTEIAAESKRAGEREGAEHVFAKDASGNYVMPTEYEDRNTVRSEAYAKTLLERYSAQSLLDVEKGLSRIQAENPTNPAEFEKAADAYLEETTKHLHPDARALVTLRGGRQRNTISASIQRVVTQDAIAGTKLAEEQAVKNLAHGLASAPPYSVNYENQLSELVAVVEISDVAYPTRAHKDQAIRKAKVMGIERGFISLLSAAGEGEEADEARLELIEKWRNGTDLPEWVTREAITRDELTAIAAKGQTYASVHSQMRRLSESMSSQIFASKTATAMMNSGNYKDALSMLPDIEEQIKHDPRAAVAAMVSLQRVADNQRKQFVDDEVAKHALPFIKQFVTGVAPEAAAQLEAGLAEANITDPSIIARAYSRMSPIVSANERRSASERLEHARDVVGEIQIDQSRHLMATADRAYGTRLEKEFFERTAGMHDPADMGRVATQMVKGLQGQLSKMQKQRAEEGPIEAAITSEGGYTVNYNTVNAKAMSRILSRLSDTYSPATALDDPMLSGYIAKAGLIPHGLADHIKSISKTNDADSIGEASRLYSKLKAMPRVAGQLSDALGRETHAALEAYRIEGSVENFVKRMNGETLGLTSALDYFDADSLHKRKEMLSEAINGKVSSMFSPLSDAAEDSGSVWWKTILPMPPNVDKEDVLGMSKFGTIPEAFRQDVSKWFMANASKYMGSNAGSTAINQILEIGIKELADGHRWGWSRLAMPGTGQEKAPDEWALTRSPPEARMMDTEGGTQWAINAIRKQVTAGGGAASPDLVPGKNMYVQVQTDDAGGPDKYFIYHVTKKNAVNMIEPVMVNGRSYVTIREARINHERYLANRSFQKYQDDADKLKADMERNAALNEARREERNDAVNMVQHP